MKFRLRLPPKQSTIAKLVKASRDTSEAIPLSDADGTGMFRIFGHVAICSEDGEKAFYFQAVHAVPLH
jgi:hypothetical protein